MFECNNVNIYSDKTTSQSSRPYMSVLNTTSNFTFCPARFSAASTEVAERGFLKNRPTVTIVVIIVLATAGVTAALTMGVLFANYQQGEMPCTAKDG